MHCAVSNVGFSAELVELAFIQVRWGAGLDANCEEHDPQPAVIIKNDLFGFLELSFVVDNSVKFPKL